MLSTREWLLIVAIAVVGAAGTMIYRAMMYAFRIVVGIAGQSLSALAFWAVIGIVAVFILRVSPRTK